MNFDKITLKNFLSTGAVTQSISLGSSNITLILGENLDLGGSGARNGVGKSALIQALSYVLYGSPISNIRKDNLINRTNGKNMLVTLEFTVDNKSYKIERGRRPNVLRFYEGGKLRKDSTLDQGKEADGAQGENKETQREIERILGMSQDMFSHIVALNTYSQPFLALGSGEQRRLIEQLLGITQLSEKADLVKEKIRVNKEAVQLEEFRIKAVTEANKRVQEQIESFRNRQNLWRRQHDQTVQDLLAEYGRMAAVNIEQELAIHDKLAAYESEMAIFSAYKQCFDRFNTWETNRKNNIASLEAELNQLNHINISDELEAHKKLAEYIEIAEFNRQTNQKLTRLKAELVKTTSNITKLEKEIETLNSNKCYACGQDFHDSDNVVAEKNGLLDEARKHFGEIQKEISENVPKDVPSVKPKPFYKSESDAVKHEASIASLRETINQKQLEINPYADQLETEWDSEIAEPVGVAEKSVYRTRTEAIEHRTKLEALLDTIATKDAEKDPYTEQLADMESTAIQEIKYDELNKLTKDGDHLKFLFDLLTNKDSFIRKRIIEQSLEFLNLRLEHYLEKIGLPHSVVFQPDLSVEITELGRSLDFHNLSRGEMNRVILATAWTFREVWEHLYQPINIMFIDELLDSGMDVVGMECSVGVLKEMNRDHGKSIWVISHRDELTSRVSSTLTVVKTNGFTEYRKENIE